jgi:hypothetical protein
LLTACGGTPPSQGGSGEGPTAGEPTTTPELTATAAAAATFTPGSIEARAADNLSKKAGIDVTSLKLTAKESQEWNDSSLGCPAKGMMYMQVITPGYKLTFSDGGKTYDVHTDESGGKAVWCQNSTPVELQPGN